MGVCFFQFKRMREEISKVHISLIRTEHSDVNTEMIIFSLIHKGILRALI
jgi:hypothetical protein